MLGNLSSCSGVTGDFDRRPGCLRAGRLCFQIPCCHVEKKCCVEFEHTKKERKTLSYSRVTTKTKLTCTGYTSPDLTDLH